MDNIVSLGAHRTAGAERTAANLYAALPRMARIDWRPSPQRKQFVDFIDSLPEHSREAACDSTGDPTAFEMYRAVKEGVI